VVRSTVNAFTASVDRSRGPRLGSAGGVLDDSRINADRDLHRSGGQNAAAEFGGRLTDDVAEEAGEMSRIAQPPSCADGCHRGLSLPGVGEIGPAPVDAATPDLTGHGLPAAFEDLVQGPHRYEVSGGDGRGRQPRVGQMRVDEVSDVAPHPLP